MSGRTTIVYSAITVSLGLAGISLDPGTIADDVRLGRLAPEQCVEGDAGDLRALAELSEAQMRASLAPEPTMCPVQGDVGTGDHVFTLTHDQMTRTYRVHVPPGYDPALPTPVVVDLHGSYPPAQRYPGFSGMKQVADQRGFVVVYPEGFLGSWNAGQWGGAASVMDVDDVGFVNTVVHDVTTRLCVDTERVYATGHYTGGAMAHRLACESSHVFAAVGVVGARNASEHCALTRAVPIIGYHHTRDDMVDFQDAEVAFRTWAALDGCSAEVTRTQTGSASCASHTACQTGAEVTFCTLDSRTSCWPGPEAGMCHRMSDTLGGDLDTPAHMWDFLSRFTLP